MRIAVIDDERPARSELIHQIREVCPDCTICEADSGASALALVGTEVFDILFVDINLGDMEGTVFAAAAKKIQPEAKLIFATAYSQYAVKAFELEADNYILKPFSAERVSAVLKRCMAKTEMPSGAGSRPGCDRLATSSNRKIIFVKIKDIVYIETEGRGCRIHTAGGDYLDSQPIGELERQLTLHGFFRIHKSYLVDVERILELFPWAQNSLAIKMQGFEHAVLPVGRDKVKPLRQLLGV